MPSVTKQGIVRRSFTRASAAKGVAEMSQIHVASTPRSEPHPERGSGRALSTATLSTSELFKSVNDQINLLGLAFLGLVDFVCECPDEMCTRVMPMTHEEYDALRS